MTKQCIHFSIEPKASYRIESNVAVATDSSYILKLQNDGLYKKYDKISFDSLFTNCTKLKDFLISIKKGKKLTKSSIKIQGKIITNVKNNEDNKTLILETKDEILAIYHPYKIYTTDLRVLVGHQITEMQVLRCKHRYLCERDDTYYNSKEEYLILILKTKKRSAKLEFKTKEVNFTTCKKETLMKHMKPEDIKNALCEYINATMYQSNFIIINPDQYTKLTTFTLHLINEYVKYLNGKRSYTWTHMLKDNNLIKYLNREFDRDLITLCKNIRGFDFSIFPFYQSA